jgi:DNA-binding NarL/FixJ family response regulator
MSDGSTAVSRQSRATKTILFAQGEGKLGQSLALSLRTSGYHLIVASGGEEALQKALEFEGPIHLLLANVEMTDMTGVKLAQRLDRARPDTKILLLSRRDSGMLVLDHGWQFLPAPFEADMLHGKIRDILRNSRVPTSYAVSRHESLTKREIQVLRLIAAGNGTKQAAAVLGIAFKTAVGHRARLMKKLNIHDSVNLVLYAIRAGLVDA